MLWDSYTRPANLDDGDDGWVRGPEVLPLSIHPRGNVDFEMVCVSGRCLRMRAEQQAQHVTSLLGKQVVVVFIPAVAAISARYTFSRKYACR